MFSGEKTIFASKQLFWYEIKTVVLYSDGLISVKKNELNRLKKYNNHDLTKTILTALLFHAFNRVNNLDNRTAHIFNFFFLFHIHPQNDSLFVLNGLAGVLVVAVCSSWTLRVGCCWVVLMKYLLINRSMRQTGWHMAHEAAGICTCGIPSGH